MLFRRDQQYNPDGRRTSMFDAVPDGANISGSSRQGHANGTSRFLKVVKDTTWVFLFRGSVPASISKNRIGCRITPPLVPTDLSRTAAAYSLGVQFTESAPTGSGGGDRIAAPLFLGEPLDVAIPTELRRSGQFYGGQDSEEWGPQMLNFYPTYPRILCTRRSEHVFPYHRYPLTVLPVHQQTSVLCRSIMHSMTQRPEYTEHFILPAAPSASQQQMGTTSPGDNFDQCAVTRCTRTWAFHVWSDSDIAPSAILDHSQYMHAPIDVSQDYGALRDVRHSSDYSISPLSSPSSPSAHTTADGIPSLLPLGIDCQWQNCTAHIPCRTYQAIQAHLKDAHLDSRGTPWKERRRIEGRCMWVAALPIRCFTSLAKHIASTHLGATRVACRYGCGKTQSRKSELERHYRTCPKLLELTSQSAQGDIGGSGASVGGRPLYE
ncbi:hypothetical protein B0H21DRAFT_886458 [Amylocystis lapponica]|nr:hypothetical protein B0H21DRAFT_886458 [Amylocystis lapponica]